MRTTRPAAAPARRRNRSACPARPPGPIGWGGCGRRRDRGQSSSASCRTRQAAPCTTRRDRDRGVLYMAQLAWSGNWQMSFGRDPGGDRTRPNQLALAAELGMRFDCGGALALPPGASFALPEVAFTAAGDLDDAANQLHRYQRSAIPRRPAGDPLLVQFNSWYPFSENVSAGELKRAADVAAQLGIEAFVLDSGWYNKKDWSRELGDYQPNLAKFPN